jgi:hypothetical protein
VIRYWNLYRLFASRTLYKQVQLLRALMLVPSGQPIDCTKAAEHVARADLLELLGDIATFLAARVF